ncbi:hypothetical protein Y1Q_0022482 [Alligator mississippiensis]|uniref:Uncharacterized protein n=1 Tax=Alligator mississippiensis TaxID=8496 RepID=A0A151N0E8_ALLMI|nr:hypothetical protein Y1Q_0022482 [Alligator mississippiensis]
MYPGCSILNWGTGAPRGAIRPFEGGPSCERISRFIHLRKKKPNSTVSMQAAALKMYSKFTIMADNSLFASFHAMIMLLLFA